MPSISRCLILLLLGLWTLPACLALPPEQDGEATLEAPAPEPLHAAQATSCLARPLLTALGKSRVLVGGR
ncbi:hypothetical protein F0U59_43085 [Archangium gephyra]|nr:hypothetical protein F0U59_43085 [Archangium gephyra]